MTTEPELTELELEQEEDARVEEGANLLRDKRRLAYFVAILVLGIVAIYVVFPKIVGFEDSLEKMDDATWYWIVVAIGFNLAAFAAYVLLFKGVLAGGVGEKVHERLDIRTSYQITMAGLAATRIFSAAGVGGLVVTYWALRKAGMERRRAACRMVAFLALTYVFYLAALIIFGVLLRTGVLPGANPPGGTIVPGGGRGRRARAARTGRADPRRRRAAAGRSSRRGTGARASPSGWRSGPATLATGVRTAIAYVGHPKRGFAGGGRRARLLGREHRDPLGELRGLRRRRPVRRAGPGLLRGHGGEPDPVAGGRRRVGGRRDDRRVRPVRHTHGDRLRGRADLPCDRVLAADPAGIIAYVQLRKTVARWEAEDRQTAYTSESKVTAEATT